MREHPLHLLAVDDEPLSGALITRTFAADKGIRVTTTTSPIEGLAIASRDPVDLAVVDQRMPEMSGVDFLVRLHALAPDAVRILLTAYPDLGCVVRAVNEGHVYHFLTKPCDPDDLEITVRRAAESLDFQRNNGLLTQRLRAQNIALEKALSQLRTIQGDSVRTERLTVLGQLAADIAGELATPAKVFKQEERRLEESVKRMLHLAHELEALRPGQPLSGATLAALASLDPRRIGEEARASLLPLRRAAAVIDDMVLALRNFAEPAGRPMERWSVRTSVEAALAACCHSDRVIVAIGPDEVPPVIAIGSELTRVFGHLLDNAFEAQRGQAGEVRVSISTDLGWVRVEVRDTGCGMDASLVQRAFAPFTTTKGRASGRGLGLSICRRIIEKHAGRIEIRSTPGQGTCVTVLIPATQDSLDRVWRQSSAG